MKYILVITVFMSHMAFGESKDFNKAINEDLKTEINKDDFKFKKKSHRAPASVQEEVTPRPVVREPAKIDKTIRQIGPQKW